MTLKVKQPWIPKAESFRVTPNISYSIESADAVEYKFDLFCFISYVRNFLVFFLDIQQKKPSDLNKHHLEQSVLHTFIILPAKVSPSLFLLITSHLLRWHIALDYISKVGTGH